MDPALLSTLKEVAAADEQIMKATIRRHEAWRSFLSGHKPAKKSSVKPKPATRGRKRPPSSASAEPTKKVPRADDSAMKFLTSAIWGQHYGTVSKWKRDGGGDRPLVLDNAPRGVSKKTYDMTVNQMHALAALKVENLQVRSRCRLLNFGFVDIANTSLRSLFIHKNDHFAEFDESIVGGLEVLEALEVIECRHFRRLPEDIGRMTNLRVLRIHTYPYHTQRGILPHSVFDLHRLEVLEVVNFMVDTNPGDGSEAIPGKIEAMVHLKSLHFDNTEAFTKWSSSWMKLGTLEELTVLSCGDWPAGVPWPARLKSVTILGAGITTPHDSIAQLQNLRLLDLRGNKELDVAKLVSLTKTCRMLSLVDYDYDPCDDKIKPMPRRVNATLIGRRNYLAALEVLKCGLRRDQDDESRCPLPREIMTLIAAHTYGKTTDEANAIFDITPKEVKEELDAEEDSRG